MEPVGKGTREPKIHKINLGAFSLAPFLIGLCNALTKIVLDSPDQ
jgi:hypothetical protein